MIGSELPTAFIKLRIVGQNLAIFTIRNYSEDKKWMLSTVDRNMLVLGNHGADSGDAKRSGNADLAEADHSQGQLHSTTPTIHSEWSVELITRFSPVLDHDHFGWFGHLGNPI